MTFLPSELERGLIDAKRKKSYALEQQQHWSRIDHV